MARKIATVKGIEEIMTNLNKALANMEGSIETKGFIEVAIAVRQHMNSTPPLIPVDTGNLRASYFTVTKRLGQVDMANPPLVKPDKVSASYRMFQKSVVAEMNALSKSKPYPNMIFGFSANYATIVHEDLTPKQWNVPGSGPKYFEAHLKALQGEILQILARNIKAK